MAGHARRTFLVLHANGLGDFLCMLPTLVGLRRWAPEARIVAVTSTVGAELLELAGVADHVLALPGAAYRRLYRRPRLLLGLLRAARRFRPTATLSAHDECTTSALLAFLSGAPVRVGFREVSRGARLYTHRLAWDPALHVIPNRYRALELLARVLGGSAPPPLTRTPLPVPPAGAAAVAARRRSLGVERLVVLHPFAQRAYREWPLRRFAALARSLVERHPDLGCAVLTDGRPVAGFTGPRIAVVPRTSLGELLAFVSEADLFVGNNSGPMHAAVTQGTPTVWIHGPSAPAWFPYWPEVPTRRLAAGLGCQPCETPHAVPGVCRAAERPGGCLEEVSVEAVRAAVEELLARGRPRRAAAAAS